MKKIIRNAIILILIDQLVKQIVTNNVYESISIIDNFFSLTYVKNTGAAFSILEGNRIIFIIGALISLFLIYKFLIKDEKINKTKEITYSLLISGIIGNMIDRIIYGYVIDYFDFTLFGNNMPIFNIADICIVIGATIFILETVVGDKHERIHRR